MYSISSINPLCQDAHGKYEEGLCEKRFIGSLPTIIHGRRYLTSSQPSSCIAFWTFLWNFILFSPVFAFWMVFFLGFFGVSIFHQSFLDFAWKKCTKIRALFLPTEAHPCLLKKHVFLFFLPWDAWICFCEGHRRASWKWGETCFLCFFLPRGHGLLPQEARICSASRASRKWKNTFFCPRKARFCFRERHEKQKKCVFFEEARFSRSVFLSKKSLSKSINMESCFKNLDMRNPTVKMIRDLDARFKK